MQYLHAVDYYNKMTMKQFIMLLYAVVAASTGTLACDVCGCAAGGQYLGLLPGANRNFIGFQYLYNGLRSDHPSLFENWPDEHSENHYNTFQVWGRYAAGKRIQLFAFLPYRYNLQYGDSVTFTSSGIGDVSLLANIVVLNSREGRGQQQFLAGAGVKMPTGKYIGISEMDKLGLPNLQPGTGSWDFVANGNYTLKKGAYGVNADATYAITTTNSSQYKYGNRLGVTGVAFRSVDAGNTELLPQAGVRYEFALHDYNNFRRKWLNEQSGGYVVFATAGMQGYYKKIGARVNYLIPINQHYSSGFVTVKQRIDLSVFFLF